MASNNDRSTARTQIETEDDVLSGKICARRNALMAQWATTVLDLDDAQSYADELTQAAASGDAGLLTRIREDFRAAGIDVIDEVLQDRMVALLRSAAAELRWFNSAPVPGHSRD